MNEVSATSHLTRGDEVQVLSLATDEFESVICRTTDARYALRWGDYVANVWNESYPTLSLAVARLAALLYCQEADWDLMLAVEPDEFAGRVLDLHDEVTA